MSDFFTRFLKFVGLFLPTFCRFRVNLMSDVGLFVWKFGCRVFSPDNVGNFVYLARHVSGAMSGYFRVGFFQCLKPDGVGKFVSKTRHVSGVLSRHVSDVGQIGVSVRTNASARQVYIIEISAYESKTVISSKRMKDPR